MNAVSTHAALTSISVLQSPEGLLSRKVFRDFCTKSPELSTSFSRAFREVEVLKVRPLSTELMCSSEKALEAGRRV
jgi:hypothetical protein